MKLSDKVYDKTELTAGEWWKLMEWVEVNKDRLRPVTLAEATKLANNAGFKYHSSAIRQGLSGRGIEK